MTLQQFKKEEAKREVRFWLKIADLQEQLVYLKFTLGQSFKRDFNQLMKDERKVSEIEL